MMDQATAGGLAEAIAKKPAKLRRLSSFQLECLRKVREYRTANPTSSIQAAILATGVSNASYYLANKVEKEVLARNEQPGAVANDAEAFDIERRGRKPGARLSVAEEWGDDEEKVEAKPKTELGATKAIMKLLEPFDLPARARIATAASVLAKAIRPWREQ